MRVEGGGPGGEWRQWGGDLLGYTLLSFPSYPHSCSASSPSSLVTLMGGGQHSAQVWAPHIGQQQGGHSQSRYQGGGRVVWAQQNDIVIAIVSVARVRNRRGWDWVAPEVQVESPPACDRVVRTGGGVARGGGLGWLHPGWGLGVGWGERAMG